MPLSNASKLQCQFIEGQWLQAVSESHSVISRYLAAFKGQLMQ